MSSENSLPRRSVLKTTGGALVGVGATGLASAARDQTVEVNVGYRAESGRNAALAAADEVVREFAFDALTVRLPAKAVSSLAERADVRYVEENGRMEALAQTLPWGVDRIDADVAHANGYTGDGAHVAIIGSGIDADHPDLQEGLGEGKAFVPCQDYCSACGPCETPWDDDNGHGTHIAGIIGADDNSEGIVGVAPDATLHAVKVLDCDGSGTYSDVAAGIEYTADVGWDVANLSLGGDYSSTLQDACEYAYQKGVLLVGAAGNSGPCTDCVVYPAAFDTVIAVTSTDSSDSLSSFSSTGQEVELAAPGEDIYSVGCNDGYDSLSGTSMAAPHVSGAGAILMALGYTNTEARDCLNASAEDIGLSSDEQGNGLVDVPAAINYCANEH